MGDEVDWIKPNVEQRARLCWTMWNIQPPAGKRRKHNSFSLGTYLAHGAEVLFAFLVLFLVKYHLILLTEGMKQKTEENE